MGQDEAKEQTFQTLLNVRHTYYLQGALDCAVLFPLWDWNFKQIVTSPWPFLAVIKGCLGSVFYLSTAQNQIFYVGKGGDLVDLFQLLVTEGFANLLDISRESVKSILSQIIQHSKLQIIGSLLF